MSIYSIAVGLVVLLAIPLSVCAQSPQAATMAQPAPQSPAQVQYVVQAQPEADEHTRSREIVWGPGPIGLTLAAVGRRLSTLDRRHVWRIERTAYVRTHQTVVYQQVPKPQHATYVAVPRSQCAPPAQVFQYQTILPQTYAMTSEQAPPPPAVLQSPAPTAQH